MRRNILLAVIVGIRPQFIKYAALMKSIEHFNKSQGQVTINVVGINTGQHYDDKLARSIFNEHTIKFAYEFKHKNKNPTNILANSIIRISQLFESMTSKPDWIIVFGDGTPAMAGAIAGARQCIPIAHIEAGVLRNLCEPESVTRKVVDSISTAFFCVTLKDVQTLREEGVLENVFWTGDLAYEFFMDYASTQSIGLNGFPSGKYVLVTLHRQGNIRDQTVANVISVLSAYERPICFIGHPRTLRRIDELGLPIPKHMKLLEPLTHGQIISAIKGSAYILTDSGGLIRESYYLKKRCLVRRNVGGWPLLIDKGIHKRVGSSEKDLHDGVKWIENSLKDEIFQIDGMIRENGSEIALKALINLMK